MKKRMSKKERKARKMQKLEFAINLIQKGIAKAAKNNLTKPYDVALTVLTTMQTAGFNFTFPKDSDLPATRVKQTFDALTAEVKKEEKEKKAKATPKKAKAEPKTEEVTVTIPVEPVAETTVH